MSKPDLKLIQGEKEDTKLVELVETPERVEFKCPACGLPCVIYPKSKPLAVQHAIPTCADWQKGDTAAFLAKSGAHLHIPKDDN